ncbi:MAG TPA: glycoside hydrolase family 16 protein [Marmoricola sp.]|nr:glycoside hydrolase family 16 protein [Marmoricola sp.]
MPSQSIERHGTLAPDSRSARWLALLLGITLAALPLAGASAAGRRTSRLTLAAPHAVMTGSTFTLSGRLRPDRRGRVVVIQRRTATGWHTVRRTRTNARSHYRARLVSGGVGVVRYRSRVSATARTTRAVSRTHKVTITPWQPCGRAPVKPDGSPWRCTFDDEFDTRTADPTALDPTKWAPQVSARTGYYTGSVDTGVVCYTADRDTVSVSGGALHLSVVPTGQPLPCGVHDAAYRGGSVRTFDRFSQTYGLFEVRARLPQARVPGLQETLWLYPELPAYGAWPMSGEIDYAEFYSKYPDLDIPYLHYAYDDSTVDQATHTNTVTTYQCRIDPTRWNTYGVDWEPGTITIYRNGEVCLVDHYRSLVSLPQLAPFDQPFRLVLTQAVGIRGNAPTAQTPFPATMDVDYVRAWK